MQKLADLTAAGLLVLPTMAGRLVTDRPAALRELIDAHTRAAASPPPDVTARPWRP